MHIRGRRIKNDFNGKTCLKGNFYTFFSEIETKIRKEDAKFQTFIEINSFQKLSKNNVTYCSVTKQLSKHQVKYRLIRENRTWKY